jgi:hypothetical protein
MADVFRKEVKYVILKSEFYRVKSHIEELLRRDQNSDMFGYMVRSLYFDSVYDNDLYDTLDGYMEKRKIRLRIYRLDQDVVKLEYKCKSGSDSRKYSLNITREQAKCMEKGDYSFLSQFAEPIAGTIYRRLIQGAYLPKTVVEYQRIAYQYPVSDVRVTFDTEIRTTGTPYGFLEKDLGYYYLMPTDRGVLEVKYNQFLPYPIKHIIESIDRLPTANSKYAQARIII